MDRPSAGSVKADNFELGKLKDEDLTVFCRQRIGFIFQNYNLVPVLNVYENIVIPIQLDGKRPDDAFIPVLIFFAVLIPYLCFRNLEKHSIVERLRIGDM